MKWEMIEKWWCGLEWCILYSQKSGVQISLKNEILCNRRVSVWNPGTLKEIVRFVHEVHLVFAVTLSTLLHMLFVWITSLWITFL